MLIIKIELIINNVLVKSCMGLVMAGGSLTFSGGRLILQDLNMLPFKHTTVNLKKLILASTCFRLRQLLADRVDQ